MILHYMYVCTILYYSIVIIMYCIVLYYMVPAVPRDRREWRYRCPWKNTPPEKNTLGQKHQIRGWGADLRRSTSCPACWRSRGCCSRSTSPCRTCDSDSAQRERERRKKRVKWFEYHWNVNVRNSITMETRLRYDTMQSNLGEAMQVRTAWMSNVLDSNPYMMRMTRYVVLNPGVATLVEHARNVSTRSLMTHIVQITDCAKCLHRCVARRFLLLQ